MTFATATLTTFDVQISAIQERIAELQAQLSEVQSRRQSAQAIEQMGQSAIDQVLAMLGSCDQAGFPELKEAFIVAIRDVIAGTGPIAFIDAGEPEPQPTPPAPSDAPDEPIVTVDISAPTVEQFAASALPAAPEKERLPVPAKPAGEPTIADVKARFVEQFNYGQMEPKKVTAKFVKDILRNRIPSQDFMMATSLECAGKDFWVAALRVMDKLAKVQA